MGQKKPRKPHEQRKNWQNSKFGCATFAWFTSKDEVTNRLSANADYDVKLVESFAPPANWLPGNKINKDVYATNTGSTAAFVKETVTSKITIAREKRVASTGLPVRDLTETTPGTPDQTSEQYHALLKTWFESTNAGKDFVKLDSDERYSVEAGSYLALAPVDSALNKGRIIVEYPEAEEKYYNKTDATDVKTKSEYDALDESAKANYVKGSASTTDFKPDAEGLYVFRRVINVNGGDPADYHYRTEEFEYEAYYYYNNEFYKVELTSITEDGVRDLANDGVFTDGNLTAATFNFFEIENKVETPTLTYDAENTELIATVAGYSYDGSDIVALGQTYDTKAHNYEEDLLKYAGEVMNYEDATATEKQSMLDWINALIAQKAAQEAYDNDVANYTSLKAQRDDVENKRSTKESDVNSKKTALYGANLDAPIADSDVESAIASAKADSNPDTAWSTWKNSQNVAASTTYANYLDKLWAYKNANTDDEAAFLAELKAYAEGQNITVDSSDTITTLANKLGTDKIRTFTATCQHTQHKAFAEYLVAKKTFEDAKDAYDTANDQLTALTTRKGELDTAVTGALTDLYGAGHNDGTYYPPDHNPTSANVGPAYSSWGSFGALEGAKATTNSKLVAYESARDTAQGTAATSAKSRLDAAYDDLVTKKSELDAAKLAYDRAKADRDKYGDIIIHIGVPESVIGGGTAEKWQLLPVKTAPDAFENNTAVFYYTSILEGGETSKMLIDYVTLDPSVNQYMYKSFDFDLDIKLDSVQVTTAATDNNTAATGNSDSVYTGVATPGELGATVTLSDPTDINTALAWAAP